ncbi:MAG: GNAT family N-acetyltransferase [Actinomycetota bacterium]
MTEADDRHEPAPTIVGDHIRLRALRADDVAVRARLGQRVEVARGFGAERPVDRIFSTAEAEASLRRRWGAGPHWVIADDADRLIGTCRLAPLDQQAASARFAIGILDPERLDQGLGTEAGRLALHHGFDTLGLHRIDLLVLAANRRAVASYRKLGFEVEGRLRHTLRRHGRWEDDLLMAVLAPGTDAPQASPPGSGVRDPAPSAAHGAAALQLRPLGMGDEAQFVAGKAAMEAEGFGLHRGHRPDRPWRDFLDHLERSRHEHSAPAGLVAETWLGAFIGDELVGSGSLRHRMSPRLFHEGGHIGYGVLPAHRRRGYATEILRQCLVLARADGIDPVLVTCNDDNIASATVIERCGGVLDNVVTGHDGRRKRRYWIH